MAAAASDALFDYQFCQHMGWTGNQMDQEPAWRVELWQEIYYMQLQEAERNRPKT